MIYVDDAKIPASVRNGSKHPHLRVVAPDRRHDPGAAPVRRQDRASPVLVPGRRHPPALRPDRGQALAGDPQRGPADHLGTVGRDRPQVRHDRAR